MTDPRTILEGMLNAEALNPPADEIDIAVAEGVLGVTLPQSLKDFYAVTNGVSAGEAADGPRLFSTEELVEPPVTPGAEWALPNFLVVGVAGDNVALVMQSHFREIMEVHSDPWDPATVRTSADSPLEFFLNYRGTAIADRPVDWALPGWEAHADAAVESAILRRDRLRERGLFDQMGTGEHSLSLERAREIVESEQFEGFLLNLKPSFPGSQRTPLAMFGEACNYIAEQLGGDWRTDFEGPEGMPVDSIRYLLFTTVLGYALEEFSSNYGPDHQRQATAMLKVLEEGRLPLGFEDGTGRLLYC